LTPKLVRPKRSGDDRGWFSETYNVRRYKEAGIDVAFCQDNHSFSREPGVIRGLHFQAPPTAQAKLVRCVRGSIWDVAVDIRRGSPSYGRWVAAELSAGNGIQIFVPIGFAHGFVTLEPGCEVEYKVSDFYDPRTEGGVIWSDPALAIPWPLNGHTPTVSGKDMVLPVLADLDSPFHFDGEPLAEQGVLT
jgi:dTDP-4-dehydrorhamnose 3,5-epimerase